MIVSTETRRFDVPPFGERKAWRARILVEQWIPIGLGFFKKDKSEVLAAYPFETKREADTWAEAEARKIRAEGNGTLT